MIEADVMRLRLLRNAALRARALARALNAGSGRENTLFARSAVVCWGIARVATGRLRAHPYLSYQKGPGPLRELADRAIASAAAVIAHYRKRKLEVLAQELKRVVREVDDARALTRSSDFSDSLGRNQLQLRRLARDFADATPQRDTALDAHGVGALKAIEAESNWPYLAI